jgi:hypothetical protein
MLVEGPQDGGHKDAAAGRGALSLCSYDNRRFRFLKIQLQRLASRGHKPHKN